MRHRMNPYLSSLTRNWGLDQRLDGKLLSAVSGSRSLEREKKVIRYCMKWLYFERTLVGWEVLINTVLVRVNSPARDGVISKPSSVRDRLLIWAYRVYNMYTVNRNGAKRLQSWTPFLLINIFRAKIWKWNGCKICQIINFLVFYFSMNLGMMKFSLEIINQPGINW